MYICEIKYYLIKKDLTIIHNIFCLEIERSASEAKTEISNVNSKLDEHVKDYSLNISDTKVELLNMLVKITLLSKDNHVPKEILQQWVGFIIKDKTLNRPISEFKRETSNLEKIYKLKEENTIGNFIIKFWKLL